MTAKQQQAQLQRPQRSRAKTQPARRGANHQQRREDRGEPARTPQKKMAGIAEGRLREERRSWRKDHPIGFVARPRSKADGSTDLLNWDVVIPGKKDTMWEGCEFNLTMEFSSDYPATRGA